MAVLLKRKYFNSKGIIIFSHKEWAFLDKAKKDEISLLKNNYFLGFNVGGYLNKVSLSENVDFAFTDDLIANFDRDVFKIELTDTNFLPNDFYFMKIKERYFDICAVSSTLNLKKNRDLLYAIKKLNKKGLYPKLIMILTQSNSSNSIWHDNDLIKLKNELFKPNEQKYLTIILLSKELGFKGIPQHSINWFKNHSKYFYAGSEYEGTCRSSHEALICGCKIIYYRYTKSLIPKYLSPLNSFAFDSYSKLDKCIESCLSEYHQIDDKQYFEKMDFLLSARYSKEKLQKAFSELFKSKGELLIGDLININDLSNDLPAHNLNVPWFKSGTADILSEDQLNIFLNYINNIKTELNFDKKEELFKKESFKQKIKYKLVLFKLYINRLFKF